MRLVILSAAALLMSGCVVAKTTGKVAAAPFKVVGKTAEVTGKSVYYTGKGVAKTGELAGKTVYHTGKFAGESVYHTGKFAGESAYYTGLGAYKVTEFAGKTVYHVGRTPVVITNAALDTTSKVLRVTEQTIDITGKAYNLSRDIPRTELEPYLEAVKSADNILEVLVERVF